MNLPRQKRDETSATITQTLWLVVLGSGLFVATTYASDPAWWSTPGPDGAPSAVMPPQVVTNGDVVTTNYVSNDYAVVTQGQLKHFTACAVGFLNTNLAIGAGTNLNNLVYGWAQDYATNGYATNTANPTMPYKPSDFQAENVGQLKYVGNMVWAQLVASGYTNAVPSWLALNTNTDNAIANLGQLKEVFNFDLTNSQGLPDTWELEYFGQLGENPNEDFDGNGFTLLQDFLGNANPTNYYSQPGISGLITPTLTIVSGSNQAISQGDFAPLPLVVQVSNSSGAVLANAPVTFSVISGGGLLATNDTGTAPLSTNILVTANSSGQAQVYFQQPATANTTDQIEAATGGQTVTFNETYATWPTLFSSEVQDEITLHQWNEGQANNYVAMENNNPTMVTHGLMLWLEAGSNVISTNGTVPANDGPVVSWADQTGNYTLSQASTTNLPTYVTNAINGYPAVDFNGSEWLSNSSNLGLNAGMTLVIVGTATSTNTHAYSLYLGQNNGTAGINRAVGYNTTNDELFDTGGSSSTTGLAAPASGTFLTEVTSLSSTLTNVTFYQYGVLTNTNGILSDSNTLSGVQNLSAGITMGAAGGGTNGWQGEIAEALVYDHQLSTNELTQVDSYLADKYGYYDTNATWPEAYSSDVQSYIAENNLTEAEANAYVAGLVTTPTNSLVLWLRADAGITTTNNGSTTNAVCEWADQSSNSNNVTQSTSGDQPTLVSSAINGMPALSFNGSTTYLSVPDNSSLRPSTITILAVATRLGTSGGSSGYGHILGKPYFTSSSWNSPYFSYELSQSPTAYPFMQVAVSDTNHTDEIDESVSTGQAYLFSGVYDGTNIYFRQDGTSLVTYPISGSVDNNAASALVIGQRSVNSPSEYFNGQIAEILIYNSALSDSNRELAETYLADKYGLYDPNATWLSAYSSDVQALITANEWNQSQADAYVAFLASNPPVTTDGLVLWLRADAGVYAPGGSTATNDSAVGSWQDQSANNNNAAQSSSSYQPTLVNNALNGYPELMFNGTSSYLSIPDSSSLNIPNCTIISVVTPTSNGAYQAIISKPYSSGAWIPPYASYVLAINPEFCPYLSTAIPSSTNYTSVSPSQALLTQNPVLLTATFGGYEMNFYEDETNTPTTVSTSNNSLSYSGAVNLAIGNESQYSSGAYYSGGIAEILIYNQVLSTGEQENVEGYLADKYGLNDPNATWPEAYSSAVQTLIEDNNWNEEQANAYVVLSETNPPFSTTGLELWLKADAGVTTNSSGNVSLWQDQSINQNNAFQTSNSLMPPLTLNSINGEPGITFGAGDYLQIADNSTMDSTNALTMIVVLKPNYIGTYKDSVFDRWFPNGGTLSPSSEIGIWTDTNATLYGQLFDSSDTVTTVRSSQPINSQVPYAAMEVYNGTNQSLYLNGVLNNSQAMTGALEYNGSFSNNWAIGLASPSYPYYYYSGGVCEILLYDRALNSSELQQVDTYLADKYGLYDPNATWPSAYSSDAQAEITLHQWDETQANNYVTLENSNPAMLTHGLSLWLRADTGVTSTNSGTNVNVTAIADQTGNYVLSQTTTTNQPTLVTVTNGTASFPALHFNGSQWLGSTATLAPGLNQDMTIITVGMTSLSTTNTQYALYLGANTTNEDNRDYFYYEGKEDFDGRGVGCGGGPQAGANIFVAETAELNSTMNQVTFYQNGMPTTTNPVTVSGTFQNLSPNITMGAATGGYDGWQGDIVEQLVYDHQLSSAELQQVGAYLANKYDMPFNGAAPTISPDGGSSSGTNVTITSSLTTGVLCYTLDGTTPTALSPYSTSSNSISFSLSVSALVQAAVFSSTNSSAVQLSQIASAQFEIDSTNNLPPPPTDLTVDPVSSTAINLSWDLPSLLTYSQVYVYRSTNSGGYDLIAVLSPTTTNYIDANVTTSNSYSYEVGTLNQTGIADTSASTSTNSLPPSTLTITVTTPSGAVDLP